MSILSRLVGVALLSGALLLPASSFAQSSDFTVPLPSGDMMVPNDYNPMTDGNFG